MQLGKGVILLFARHTSVLYMKIDNDLPNNDILFSITSPKLWRIYGIKHVTWKYTRSTPLFRE